MGGTRLEHIQPPSIQVGVVTGEYHGGSNAVAGLHRRDRHTVFFKNHWDFRAVVRPRHRERVAFAGLDWNPTAQVLIQEGSEWPGCHHERGSFDLSGGRFTGHTVPRFTSQGLDLDVFLNLNTEVRQDGPQSLEQAVGTQVTITLVMPRSCGYWLEGGF